MASAVIAEALLLSDTGLYDLEKKSTELSAKKKNERYAFKKVNYEHFLK